MSLYTIYYKKNEASEIEKIGVYAKNKEAAWEQATFEAIPEKEGCTPYSAWVYAVMYNNFKVKHFNTHEGKPF